MKRAPGAIPGAARNAPPKQTKGKKMGKMKELVTGLETVGDYNNSHAGKAWALSVVWLNDSIRCLECAHDMPLESVDPWFASSDNGDLLAVSCGECGVYIFL